MTRDSSLLKHMLEDIMDIQSFTKDCTFEIFKNSAIIKKGVCMSLINIGEAAKSLSDEFRSKNKEIPWKQIAGLRDIVTHKYKTIDLEIVWQTIQEDIPVLKEFIDQLTTDI